MPEAGQVHTATLVLDVYDEDTQATLAVIDPARVAGSPIAATSDDGGATWNVALPSSTYTTGGRWWHRWTVTGTGAQTKVEPVDVGPVLPPPLGRSYATTTDLANYLQEAPPQDAEQLLVKATRKIDQLIRTARYPVDDDGEPTRDKEIDALREATCELVRWWLDIGDPDGAMATLSSASAGSMSIGRAGNLKPGTSKGRVGDQVVTILHTADLLHHPPSHY